MDMSRIDTKMLFVHPNAHDPRGPGKYFFTWGTRPWRNVLSDVTKNGKLLLTPVGEIVRDQYLQAVWRYGFEFLSAALMPNHGHLCFVTHGHLPKPITQIVTDWLVFSEREVCSQFPKEQSLWNYHTRLVAAVDKDLFQRFIVYTENNPIRAMAEKDPSLMLSIRTIQHPALDPHYHWQCYGDERMLEIPDVIPVHVRHNATTADIEHQLRMILLAAQSGFTIAGGFVSDAEKYIMRTVLHAYPETRVISFYPYSLLRFKMSALNIGHFLKRRWLVLTSDGQNRGPHRYKIVCDRHNRAAERLGFRGYAEYLAHE